MNSSLSPLVMVVTPVYNGAAFLRECIESVLAQSYANWRYVILDNASTDGSREIAEEYARQDHRVRVEHNDELIPMMRNHNRALGFLDPDAAYCKPLMADDWMFPECLERMVAATAQSPTIGLVSSPSFNGMKVWGGDIQYPAACVSGRELCRRVLLEGIYVLGSPTEVLIRADLVRRYQPFYTDEHLYADYESGFQVLRDSDFAFVHQILTFTRPHNGQVSSRARWLEDWYAAVLNVVMKHGHHYLTPAELAQRLNLAWYDYYRALGRGIAQRKGKPFMDHHRAFMAAKGLSLNRYRLARATAVEYTRNMLYRSLKPILWPYMPS